MLVRKGLLTNEEVLEEIKVVRREMEETRRNLSMAEKLDPSQVVTFEELLRA